MITELNSNKTVSADFLACQPYISPSDWFGPAHLTVIHSGISNAINMRTPITGHEININRGDHRASYIPVDRIISNIEMGEWSNFYKLTQIQQDAILNRASRAPIDYFLDREAPLNQDKWFFPQAISPNPLVVIKYDSMFMEYGRGYKSAAAKILQLKEVPAIVFEAGNAGLCFDNFNELIEYVERMGEGQFEFRTLDIYDDTPHHYRAMMLIPGLKIPDLASVAHEPVLVRQIKQQLGS